MKRILLFLTLALLSLLAAAQEEVKLRVDYRSTFMDCRREKPLLVDTLIADEQTLEIGAKKAVFYSRFYQKYEEEVEEVVGRKEDVSKDIPFDIAMRWFLKQGQAYRIFRDFSQPQNVTVTTTIHFKANPYTYKDTLERIRWKVLKEDSLILGHRCRKAEADFRGRHWTVWFAKDIKYKLGPWKLGGLPGLILKATESEGIFSFDSTKIEENCGTMTEFTVYYYKPCTHREYQDEVTEYWHDSFHYICKENGHSNPPRGQVPDFEAIFIDKTIE